MKTRNGADARDEVSAADVARETRRSLFDGVALMYDRARPPYPDALVEALMSFSSLSATSRVLEIGCGTGQLTVALARSGASITAVELGPDLAERARANLRGVSRCEVVVADFDSWPLPTDRFDLVVAATSYHWLDPRSRLQRCVDALRSRGTLAIFETHWSAASGTDAFFKESQSCYARWFPDHEEFEPGPLPLRNAELETSGHFDLVHLERHVGDQGYSAAAYCELLSTFSDVCALDEPSKAGFLRCMDALIATRFADHITRSHAYTGWFARKTAGPDA